MEGSTCLATNVLIKSYTQGVKIATICLLSVQVKDNLPVLPDLHGLPPRNVRKQVGGKAMAVVARQVTKYSYWIFNEDLFLINNTDK